MLAVAAGSDGTVNVYTVSVEELMEVARSQLSRGFTDEECRTYLHETMWRLDDSLIPNMRDRNRSSVISR